MLDVLIQILSRDSLCCICDFLDWSQHLVSNDIATSKGDNYQTKEGNNRKLLQLLQILLSNILDELSYDYSLPIPETTYRYTQ